MELPLGMAVADDTVVLDGVDERLMKYAEHLALVHQLIFGRPLTITSGKEGKHVQNSFHELGRALDVRTADKDPEEILVFMTVVSFSAPRALRGEIPSDTIAHYQP